MSSLVQNDLRRATTFFALAFGMTAVGGLAIGDLRLGVEWGLVLGVGFGVFAYFFVAPTALDEEPGPDESPGDDSEEGTDDDGDGGEGEGDNQTADAGTDDGDPDAGNAE